MHPSKLQNPLWAWFILIGGGLFLLTAFPGILLSSMIPFWKRDELSFFSIIYLTFALCLLIVILWGMKRAFYAVKEYTQAKKNMMPDCLEEINTTEFQTEQSSITKKPIWPWIVIVPGALLLIISGPGAIMLPILPLLLAGMSTDSGTTPEYVPFLILTIGYGLIIGYIILVIKAVKTLRAK